MNRHDSDLARTEDQQAADELRDKLEGQLNEIKAALRLAQSEAAKLRRMIKKARRPFAKSSPEAKKAIAEAVRRECGRVATALRDKGWTFEQIGDLFGRSGAAVQVWFMLYGSGFRSRCANSEEGTG